MSKSKIAKIIIGIEWMLIGVLFALAIGRVINHNFLIEYRDYNWIAAQGAAYIFILAVIPGSMIRLKILSKFFAKFLFWARATGLLMFILATAHFVLLIDYTPLFSQWGGLTTPLIISGIISFVFLIPVALTSTNFAQKILKKHWKTVQRITYLMIPPLAFHFMQTEHYLLASLYTIVLILIISSYVVSSLRNSKKRNASQSSISD